MPAVALPRKVATKRVGVTVLRTARADEALGDSLGLPRVRKDVVTPFEVVAKHFARSGEPGIHDESPSADGLVRVPGPLGLTPARAFRLVYRNERGRAVGYIHYYPEGVLGAKHPGEYAVNVWCGARRRGIGMALIAEADRLWGLNFHRQDYTPAGRALAAKYLSSHGTAMA